MCSREEVQQECEKIERRIEAKFADTYDSISSDLKHLKESLQIHTTKEMEYQDKVEKHLAVISTSFTEENIKALNDIAQGYMGLSATRKLIIGLASVIIAIGAVVGGFITLIRAIK